MAWFGNNKEDKSDNYSTQPTSSESEMFENSVLAVSIEEIHDDFDKAQEEMLAQVKELIESSKSTVTLSKSKAANVLEKNGFENAGFGDESSVIDYNQKKMAFEKEKGFLKAMKYYSANYPTYKFISRSQVRDICMKYGLLMGESSWFNGNIPDKNIEDLSNFTIKAVDRPIEYGYERNRRGAQWFPSDIKAVITNLKKKTKGMDEKAQKKYAYTALEKKGSMSSDYDYRYKPFSIVANKELFNLDGKEVENFEIRRELPKDPIVLCPVGMKRFHENLEGGYLIITKWGKEATIDETYDPSHN